MHTTLASERSLDREAQRVRNEALTARISPVDRLSLRLGLWLLLRSTRRIHPIRDHRGHEIARAAQRARQARDAVAVEHLLRAHRS